MKTRISILFLLSFAFSTYAQEMNTPNLNSWYIGLNFGVYNFSRVNNHNDLSISIERRLNNHFTLSLGTGIGSYRPDGYYSLTSIYDNNSGNRIVKSIVSEFGNAISVPLNLSLKYEPFNWDISPYVSIGYGTEFLSRNSYTTTEKTEIYSPEGTLVNKNETTSASDYKGVFGNGGLLRLGVTYRLLSNLHLDANVLFNGINRPSLSLGVKYGF